jgi:cellulose synthase/poly-beta-1,6-N-acetylglucosamine synthase-like glycosyltransferase
MFLDGDTELASDFVAESIAEFDDPRVGVIYGHRREVDARKSVFTRVLDLEWIHPPGPSDSCGGDALVRRSVLEELGGFDETLIAGEEPELCWRIRSHGWIVLHVDRNMVKHDLDITRLSQYWRRAIRTGYAYAEVSRRFRATEPPLWKAESKHNQINGTVILGLMLGGSSLCVVLRSVLPIAATISIVLALAIRTAVRNRWKGSDSITLLLYGLHSHLQQIPILFGQMKYHLQRRRGIVPQLIEYKDVLTVTGVNASPAKRR